ncbi:hypothetical protein SAY87_005896 [Trapa incisa]|uniref:Filament-like plant protein 3 n=1 Tax=Trapa incisa TaxID=236973 RepID=A0AAN7KAM9_9MYRT|nr:hypothetical protein SAY87_005896 [Trapa incisa]
MSSMDRRSWLWRRKSSEKSPRKNESSGSISSQSDRCSGEQAYAAHTTQSPELTSKAVASDDEDANDRLKTLSERLSDALLNIQAKEELVKQHSVVAEEAVSGWEKAENEVFVLRNRLDSETKRNSSLENRVGHLDGALKECLRQIRQSREEQEKRINEAIKEKTHEWELVNSNLRQKLDAAVKENSILKSELDLSTKAAETACKQNLESIKRVTKLEAEIFRLKAMARKSATASSFCVESSMDSQSDGGDRFLAVESATTCSLWNEKTDESNLMISSLQIDLMDDFLEMERLAGLPDAEARSSTNEIGNIPAKITENPSRSDLNAMINRTAELEEEIEKKRMEKKELELTLRQLHGQFNESQASLKEADMRLTELETRLSAQVEGLRGEVKLLEEELKSERTGKAEEEEKCRALEEEISRFILVL